MHRGARIGGVFLVMADNPNILSQFKALGLVPEDADRLEIVSRKVGADQARYYLLGKCYPIAGLNVGIRPCDDAEYDAEYEADARLMAGPLIPSEQTDNDPPANGDV